MNTTEDEILVEVDRQNREIGSVVKREAHANPNRHHRAAWIFIFNPAGQVILQQRGLNKIHNPGKWDMAGGHQVFGSTIEETAHQELREEMGIDTELHFYKTGHFQNDSQSEFHYLYWGIHPGPYKFDSHEVADLKAFDCEWLLRREYDGDYQILEHVYEQIEVLRPVWGKLAEG